MAVDYRGLATAAARRAGIDPAIFWRQIMAESGGNPNARSPAGALGIAQFMPATARGRGIDPMNPQQALMGAAQMDAEYLRSYGGSWAKTLAAFNAGPGAVAKYGGVPPYAETRAYVSRILGAAGDATAAAPSGGGGTPTAPTAAAPPAPAGPHVDMQALRSYLVQHGSRGLSGMLGSFVTDAPQSVGAAPSPAQSVGGAVTDASSHVARAIGKLIGTPYSGTHTLGNWESDNAVDIALPYGTPIYAVADGKIGSQIGPLNSSNPRMAGNRLHLVTPGNEFYYAHLSKLTVQPGQRVRRGQLLGYSGAANGVNHLHFGERTLDPRKTLAGSYS